MMFKRIYTIIKRRVKRKLLVALFKKPKVVRVKAPPRPKPIRVMMPKAERKRIEPITVPMPEPVNGGLTIMELEHNHCREVIGYGTPDMLARYCGNDKRAGSSFCAYHHSRNFQVMNGRPAPASSAQH